MNCARRVLMVLAMVTAHAAAAADDARAQTLVTPNFRVTIQIRCAEGNVTCDDVRYVGRHRRTGKSISLTGRTHHTLCADGITPCRFLGYVFQNGRVRYFAGEDGLLRVTDGEKVLVEERGAWK